MKTGKIIASIALLAVIGTACADEQGRLPTEVALHAASEDEALMEGVSDLLDGSNGGNANFRWLAPVVPTNVAPPGPFVPGLQPALVEICDKHSNCTTNAAEQAGNHYHLGLKSGIDEKPRDGSPYQIRAFDSKGLFLGSFSVSLDSNRNIPLKFWVGAGFLEPEAQECVDDDRCDLGTVVSDIGGTVKVTASGEGVTEVIAAAIFPDDWSPGGINRTVVIDCRNNLPPEIATGVDGPLNTGLTQLPWYCDFSVEPALDPGQEFNVPVVVEVCETVDMDHGGVVLGKSSGPSDFELLPFVTPVTLGDCFVDYPTIPQASASLWSDVTRRLAAVFRGIGPQPLRANMRDGGAGGTVRGFSAINPVIPATISGTLTDSGASGLDNVSVTLSNGDAAVTSQGGLYSFSGLVEGSYTVTVDVSDPDFPSSETLAANTAVVQVTGSGDFVADFQTSPTAYMWAGTYSTATKFGGASGTWNPSTPVVIAANGQVTRGGVAIINPTVTANSVSWTIADGNSTNATLNFLTSSSSSYYWPAPVSGLLFQGSIQNPGSGPLDYRGLVVGPAIQSASPAAGGIGQMVTFFAQNVEFTGTTPVITPNVTATFTSGQTSFTGFVFVSPSTDTDLYIRVPNEAALLGTVDVTLTNNTSGITGPPFQYVLAQKPGTPEIVDSGALGGSTLLVNVRGIDTTGGKVCFTLGTLPQPSSGPTCNGTIASSTTAYSGDARLQIEVPTSGINTSQAHWVQVQQSGTIDSDWSAALLVQ